MLPKAVHIQCSPPVLTTKDCSPFAGTRARAVSSRAIAGKREPSAVAGEQPSSSLANLGLFCKSRRLSTTGKVISRGLWPFLDLLPADCGGQQERAAERSKKHRRWGITPNQTKTKSLLKQVEKLAQHGNQKDDFGCEVGRHRVKVRFALQPCSPLFPTCCFG